MSEIDNIIQEEEEIFKKNPTVGLLEVSKLIDSVISKRQGDRRKHSFLERKKYYIKGKMDSLWAPKISHHLMDQAMKQSTHQFHKIFFHISKCFACNAEKLLQLKITKTRMNMTNFINIYTNIYLCYMWQKLLKIKMVLEIRVIDNNYCVLIISCFNFLLPISYFRIWSVSQIVEMEGSSYHLLSYKN